MSDFTVYHSPLQEDNDSLNAAVRTVHSILEDLNGVLKNINDALQGQAAGLWIDQQVAWEQSYNTLAADLSGHATASDNVAQIFLDGDNATAFIMSH